MESRNTIVSEGTVTDPTAWTSTVFAGLSAFAGQEIIKPSRTIAKVRIFIGNLLEMFVFGTIWSDRIQDSIVPDNQTLSKAQAFSVVPTGLQTRLHHLETQR